MARLQWLFIFWVVVTGQSALAGDKPRLLLTNDDGVKSANTLALAEAIQTWADVVVVLPAKNQSGTSMSTTLLRQPLTVTPIAKYSNHLEAYAVHGTPVDAVSFGLLELGKDTPFDLVISGINDGANVGELHHWSGTVGAAKQAVLIGVPALAVSQESKLADVETALRVTQQLAKHILKHDLPHDVVYSINVPSATSKGVRICRSGGMPWPIDGFTTIDKSADESTYQLKAGGSPNLPANSDSALYLDGYVTLTPLPLARDHQQVVDQIKGLLTKVQWQLAEAQ